MSDSPPPTPTVPPRRRRTAALVSLSLIAALTTAGVAFAGPAAATCPPWKPTCGKEPPPPPPLRVQTLWHTSRFADRSWQPTSNAIGVTSDWVTSTAAASSAPGVTELVAVTNTGHLLHTEHLDGSPWATGAGDAAAAAHIPGTVIAAAAVSDRPGTAEFAVVTSDGHLWDTTRNNSDGSWIPAVDVTARAGLPATVRKIAAVSTAAGSAQFFAVTSDGRLLHTRHVGTGSSWTTADDAEAAAHISGVITAVAATSANPGSAQLVVITGDGRLLHTVRTGAVNGTWQATPDDVKAEAQIVGTPYLAAAVSADAGVAQFAVVTTDGHLLHTVRNQDRTWQDPAGDVESAAHFDGSVSSISASTSSAGVAQYFATATTLVTDP